MLTPHIQARYVTPRRFAKLSGHSEAEIYQNLANGKWRERDHFILDEDGHLLLDAAACAEDGEEGMSRRGNCHDNAVAESFFQLLKRERIRRRVYNTREEAGQDAYDYIEMFYNPKRRDGYNNRLSR